MGERDEHVRRKAELSEIGPGTAPHAEEHDV